MKTKDRIDELDIVWARLTTGVLRVDDRSLLQELILKEKKRLQRLVNVHEESKRRRIQLKLESKGIVRPPLDPHDDSIAI